MIEELQQRSEQLGLHALQVTDELRKLRPVLKQVLSLQTLLEGSPPEGLTCSEYDKATEQLHDANDRLRAVAVSEALSIEEEASFVAERDAALATYKQHLHRTLQCATTIKLSEIDACAIEQGMSGNQEGAGGEDAVDATALEDAATSTDIAVKDFVAVHKEVLTSNWPESQLATTANITATNHAQENACNKAANELALIKRALPQFHSRLPMLTEARRVVEFARSEVKLMAAAEAVGLETIRGQVEELEYEELKLQNKKSELQNILNTPERKRRRLSGGVNSNPQDHLKQVQASLLECRQKMGRLADKLAPYVERCPEILLFCPEAAGLGNACGFAGLWCDRKLDHFDQIEEMAGSGRHKVLKAVYKNSCCVLKQFAVGDARKRRQMEKEIQMLQKLRHSLIVELQAVFFDGDSYLQLPFIQHGTLREWMQSGLSPNEVQIVVRQVRYMV